MQGEDRPNIETQLIIVALKFAEFPDHISIDYGQSNRKQTSLVYVKRLQRFSEPIPLLASWIQIKNIELQWEW